MYIMSAAPVSSKDSSPPSVQSLLRVKPWNPRALCPGILSSEWIKNEAQKAINGQPSLLASRPPVIKGLGISEETMRLIASNKGISIIETPLQQQQSVKRTVPRPSFLNYGSDVFPGEVFSSTTTAERNRNALSPRVVIAIPLQEELIEASSVKQEPVQITEIAEIIDSTPSEAKAVPAAEVSSHAEAAFKSAEPNIPVVKTEVNSNVEADSKSVEVKANVIVEAPCNAETAPKSAAAAEAPAVKAEVPGNAETAPKSAAAAEAPAVKTEVPGNVEAGFKVVEKEILMESAAIVKPLEGAPNKAGASVVQQAAKGVIIGVVGPAVLTPIETRNMQIISKKFDEPSPPLSKAFDNYANVLRIAIPGKVTGALVFMCTYPYAASAVSRATNSSFLQEVAPYGICSATESSFATPISVMSQRLRLNPNEKIIGVITSIYDSQGFRGFYRGIGLQLSANMIYNMLFFPGSKMINSLLTEGRESEIPGGVRLTSSFCSGVFASSLAIPFSYPFFMIITKQRNQRPGTDNPPQSAWATTKKVIMTGMERPEGPVRGVLAEMYVGVRITWGRQTILGGIVAASSEAVRIAYEKYNKANSKQE